MPPTNNSDELITFTNQKIRVDGLEFPLQIRKCGDITLNFDFAKHHAIDDSKYIIFEASKNGERVVLHLSEKEIDYTKNFKWHNSSPHKRKDSGGYGENVLKMHSAKIPAYYKIDKAIHYKMESISLNVKYNNVKCTKLVFVRKRAVLTTDSH